jgi:hypothetical protein
MRVRKRQRKNLTKLRQKQTEKRHRRIRARATAWLEAHPRPPQHFDIQGLCDLLNAPPLPFPPKEISVSFDLEISIETRQLLIANQRAELAEMERYLAAALFR